MVFNDAQFEHWQNYCGFSLHLTFFFLSYIILVCLQDNWCSPGSLDLVRIPQPGCSILLLLHQFFCVCPRTGGRTAEETCNQMKNSWFPFSCWSQQMVLTAFTCFSEKPYTICQFIYGIYQGTAIRLTATCHFSELKDWSLKQNTSHSVESFRISNPCEFGCFHGLFSQNAALLPS